MDYYFLDWIAMATSILAVYLLGQKNRFGFAAFLVSNALWMGVGVLAESYGILLGNVVFFGLNLRGFLKWRAAPEALKVVAGGCPYAPPQASPTATRLLMPGRRGAPATRASGAPAARWPGARRG